MTREAARGRRALLLLVASWLAHSAARLALRAGDTRGARLAAEGAMAMVNAGDALVPRVRP